MKKLIFRKLLYELFLTFLVLSSSLSIIVWVIQAVNFLDIISEDGHGFKVYFAYTLFNYPKIFTKIYIFSLFISLYYLLIRYEDKNELSIYWSIGISKNEFIKKVMLFSMVFLFFHLLLTTVISPFSQNLGRSYIRSSNIDFFPSLIKEKTFIDTVRNLTIYVDQQSENKKNFKNVYIKDQSNVSDKFQIIIANKGEIRNKNKNNYLFLYNGEVFSKSNKEYSNFKFENFEFNLSEYKTKTTIIPKIQENSTKNIIKCYLNLRHKGNFYINENELKCFDNSIDDIINEILKRFSISLYIPLVCLIAGLLLVNSKIKKNYTFNKFLIFLLGFGIIFISEIIIKYSKKEEIFNLFFFIIPLITFILIYILFLKKMKKIH